MADDDLSHETSADGDGSGHAGGVTAQNRFIAAALSDFEFSSDEEIDEFVGSLADDTIADGRAHGWDSASVRAAVAALRTSPSASRAAAADLSRLATALGAPVPIRAAAGRLSLDEMIAVAVGSALPETAGTATANGTGAALTPRTRNRWLGMLTSGTRAGRVAGPTAGRASRAGASNVLTRWEPRTIAVAAAIAVAVGAPLLIHRARTSNGASKSTRIADTTAAVGLATRAVPDTVIPAVTPTVPDTVTPAAKAAAGAPDNPTTETAAGVAAESAPSAATAAAPTAIASASASATVPATGKASDAPTADLAAPTAPRTPAPAAPATKGTNTPAPATTRRSQPVTTRASFAAETTAVPPVARAKKAVPPASALAGSDATAAASVSGGVDVGDLGVFGDAAQATAAFAAAAPPLLPGTTGAASTAVPIPTPAAAPAAAPEPTSVQAALVGVAPSCLAQAGITNTEATAHATIGNDKVVLVRGLRATGRVDAVFKADSCAVVLVTPVV